MRGGSRRFTGGVKFAVAAQGGLNLGAEEGAVQFAGDAIGEGLERADGAGVDDGFGGGLEYFKAIEGFQNAASGDENAIVFQDDGGMSGGKHARQRLVVFEL